MTERYIKLVDGVEVEMTSEEIATRQSEESTPTPLSLAEQLNLIFMDLPAEVQADFSPLKAAVKLELEQDRLNIARLVIVRATVPEALESLRQTMLGLFPETETE